MDILRESSLFQSLTQQSREEAREEGFEQGREEGVEQGIEQGIEQGERRSTIEAILDVLEIRFDLSEAHPLSTRIATIDDLQRLKQLLRAAIQVPNLEAFQRILDT